MNLSNSFTTPIIKSGTQIVDIIGTRNYKIFKSLKGNRPLNKLHLLKITNSILKRNLLEHNPIIVNEKYEVIDGQHRLEVAKANDLEIFYSIVPEASISEVQQLNANLKPWSMQDYLNSYIALGYKDYQILADYAKQTGLTFAVSRYPLNGGGVSVRDMFGTRAIFRAGEYTVKDLAHAVDFAEKLEDMKSWTEPKVWMDRDFVIALIKVVNVPDFSFDQLLEGFERSGWKIARQVNVREYVRRLEDVYNFKKAGKRVRFF